jgi:type IV secretory pathway TraG/TraD family ATPase VirD4
MNRLIWMAYGLILFVIFGLPHVRRHLRKQQFTRGRQLRRLLPPQSSASGALSFGILKIKPSDATRHFLVVGTTGSGKSLVQRLLMKDVLQAVKPGNDSRALIFDAKNDMSNYLKHIGVVCPVMTLNPFDAKTDFAQSVSWDIAADITSPARALNLASSLIPAERGGSNQYFTDAARQVVSGVIESFLRHSPGVWTFSDLVYVCLSLERVVDVLERDDSGSEVVGCFLREERTAYQVFTTIVSRMAYFKPVAALWQRTPQRLSLRDWLQQESILLFGSNSTVRTALEAINEIVFRILVEEIDIQSDSTSRRTWVWIDEARLSGPLLRGPMIPYLCVKGRSRGACLVLAFQDIEGFREAAGVRIAHEIIAQCSYKAILRLESDESATWASKLLGQYETLQWMKTDSSVSIRTSSSSVTEQLSRKDAVLPSQFYLIPCTNREHGLSGYFVGPDVGAMFGTIPGKQLDSIVVPNRSSYASVPAQFAENDQWLQNWTPHDKRRLELDRDFGPARKPTLSGRERSKAIGGGPSQSWPRFEIRMPHSDRPAD